MGIEFSTDFPGGNGLCLGIREGNTEEPVTVRFAAEPKNCPIALWFHFRVTGLAGRTLRLILANPEQTLGGLDWSKNKPVYRSPDTKWQRTDKPIAIATSGGRTEWAYDLPKAQDAVEFAFCFPYQGEDFEAAISEIGDSFHTEEIGISPHGRRILRVRNKYRASDLPGVFLTARHHAGETPGSWVLEGLLRYVARSPKLRESVAWWAVPFVSIDDVVEGSYGKDPWPWDINRAYMHVGLKRPEARAVAVDVRRWAKECKPLLFIDLHAPGHRERENYVNIPLEDDEVFEQSPGAKPFAQAYLAQMPEDIRSSCAWKKRTSKVTRYEGLSSSAWARKELSIDAFTIETSYQGNEKVDYTIADYQRMGSALAETIFQTARKTLGAKG